MEEKEKEANNGEGSEADWGEGYVDELIRQTIQRRKKRRPSKKKNDFEGGKEW